MLVAELGKKFCCPGTSSLLKYRRSSPLRKMLAVSPSVGSRKNKRSPPYSKNAAGCRASDWKCKGRIVVVSAAGAQRQGGIPETNGDGSAIGSGNCT